MLNRSSAEVRAAFTRYVAAAHIDRIDTPAQIAEDRAELVDDYAAASEDVAAIFAKYQKRYAAVADAEDIVLPKHPELGTMGSRALEIRFPVDTHKVPAYEKAVARSLAQARSGHVTDMFDKLVDVLDDAKGLNHPEALVAYTLLGLTPHNAVDIRLDVDMDLDDNFAQTFDHYVAAGYASFDIWAKGSAVAPIDGGLFDLDQLIDIK
jgi:hypothetical protein